jgi:hypothetical protein
VLRRLVNLPDLRAGNTALHVCVQNGHLDAAKLLLDKGAKPNLRNAAGRSALCSAAAKNVDESVLALLIEAGAKGNVKTNFGETADQVCVSVRARAACGSNGDVLVWAVPAVPNYARRCSFQPLWPRVLGWCWFGVCAMQVAAKAGHKQLAKRIVELEAERRQREIDVHRAHNDLEAAVKM